MTKQELMKELYKQDPIAYMRSVTKTGILYECELMEGATPVWFNVPLSEIGDAVWTHNMKAKHLSRYVVEPITAY